MKAVIEIRVEAEGVSDVQEIARFERDGNRLAEIGLTLAESKSLLAAVQKIVVEYQTAEYLEGQRKCPYCGCARVPKGSHTVSLQTLFGNIAIHSPRWNHCPCQPHETKSFSPLSELLTEHVTPERLYLEVKWSSLISFELATELLKDTLPVVETINASSVRNHLHAVAERVESALGDEQVSFVEGCPRDWAALPRPPTALTVGIDGCYVREWEDKKKNFEIIVGKSMSEEAPDRRFGFVQTYDEKPKRRLFELLKEQGMQMNQQVKFFSDGGADIRDVQLYLNPEAEHYLDWFHITMRITVMGQYAKGLKTTPEKREEGLKLLESTKHYLWHGNVVRAREKIDEALGFLDDEAIRGENVPKFRKALDEFDTYIEANQGLIPKRPADPSTADRPLSAFEKRHENRHTCETRMHCSEEPISSKLRSSAYEVKFPAAVNSASAGAGSSHHSNSWRWMTTVVFIQPECAAPLRLRQTLERVPPRVRIRCSKIGSGKIARAWPHAQVTS